MSNLRKQLEALANGPLLDPCLPAALMPERGEQTGTWLGGPVYEYTLTMAGATNGRRRARLHERVQRAKPLVVPKRRSR